MSADMTSHTQFFKPPAEDIIDFQVAASLDDRQVMQDFLNKYARKWVDVTNAKGYTALMYAAMNGTPSTLAFLLENGATFGLSSDEGDTAIMLAEAYDKPDNVRFLHAWHMRQQECHTQQIITESNAKKQSAIADENIRKLKQKHPVKSVFKNTKPLP